MTREEFKKIFFEQQQKQTILTIQKKYTQNQSDYLKKIQHGLTYVLEEVKKMQEALPLPISCIQISLMRYSILSNHPFIRMDAYGELGVVEEAVVSREMAIEWPAVGIKELEEQTLKEITEKYRTQIHEEEVSVLLGETIDLIEFLFQENLRYEWKLIKDTVQLKEIMKTKDFYVSVGEYMGNQQYIYVERDEIDIFYNVEKQKLIYRTFDKAIYQNKNFVKLDLEGARFINCTFEKCEWTECRLWDCTFENCTFKRSVFDNNDMRGCLFEDCTFYRVDYSKNKCNSYSGANAIICRPYQVKRCEMRQLTYQDCELDYAVISDCTWNRIMVWSGCSVNKSDFASLQHREDKDALISNQAE